MATTTAKHDTTPDIPEQAGQWSIYIVTHERRLGTDTKLLMRYEEPRTPPLGHEDFQANDPQTYALHRDDEVLFIEYAPASVIRAINAAIQAGGAEADELLSQIEAAPEPVTQTFREMRDRGRVATVENGTALGRCGEEIDLDGGEIAEIDGNVYLFQPGDDQDIMVLDGLSITGLTRAMRSATGTKRLNAPVPADLYRRIQHQALNEERSVAEITRELWVRYLGNSNAQ